MNKYLVCLSVLALCLSLTGAVTKHELEKLIHQANVQVRARESIMIQMAAKEVMLEGTPLQQACAGSSLGTGYRDLNLAMNRELGAVENEYRLYTQEQIENLEATSLSEALFKRYSAASTAQNAINKIKSC
ncbi:uncharacterized protein [Halyomorpha halys]|uniref:uncharacterized protein n=1 Tax=Halyomorpha halys TaxID=286706 RepID=UPI0006D50C8E|nr:uncharacterized protein LOC106679196 [Halyomorpha halys]